MDQVLPPGREFGNSQVSYYEKGAILGLLLDLEIRKRSNGAKSLDDVMRALYTEFFKKNRNYTPADFQKACELMAGDSMGDWFSRFVSGVDELDYDGALAVAGLRLDRNAAAEPSTSPNPKAFFGADLAQQQNRLMVLRVQAGSPAYDQGLNAGDEIIAINNMRATKEFFDARLAEKQPGDVISLTIFRFDDLRMLPIKLGQSKEGTYRIRVIEKPSDQQRRIYQAWLAGRSR